MIRITEAHHRTDSRIEPARIESALRIAGKVYHCAVATLVEPSLVKGDPFVKAPHARESDQRKTLFVRGLDNSLIRAGHAPQNTIAAASSIGLKRRP